MYAYEIIIQNHNTDIIHDAYTYLYFLEATGQIVRDKNLVSIENGLLTISVFTFEKDAFLKAYHDKYGWETKKEIESKIGTRIIYQQKGRDADNPHYSIPQNPSFLLFRFGWASPILSEDTYNPIPLYRLFNPWSENKIFDDIRYWDREYSRIFHLWISSGSYEAFAQKELKDINSALNKEGLKLCKEIEKLTRKPTFYHLFNNRTWSKNEDRNQKCPLCHGEWLIAGKNIDDAIAFKCEKCRLTSELSPDAV